MVSIKLFFNSEIRRIPVDEKDFNINHFVQVAKQLFSNELSTIGPNSEIRFCYNDDENDRVTCSSDSCFQEALRLYKLKNQNAPLRFDIVVRETTYHNDAPQVSTGPLPVVSQVLSVPEPTNPSSPMSDSNNSPAVSEIEANVDLSFKHPAYCDKCETVITGIRFKCRRCPDFDYCSGCYTTNSATHGHPFVKMFKSRKHQSPVKKHKQDDPQPNQEEKNKKLEEEQKRQEEQKKREEEQKKKPDSSFEQKLRMLEEIGFTDRARNIKLLVEKKCDTTLVIAALLEENP
eukprot:TRINITY_DN13779_c0_g2_i2.p1 TRINITY_DN13779_c0_g2~~TRINITY_DN13779_c0_g2_i2.p1  ORF type:complete len:289 (+),score=44.74 TRINITY_DN13779_c0_g2_i2:29-895(+)